MGEIPRGASPDAPGWFETQAEEEERLQRELEWTETEDNGVVVVRHRKPGPTAELVALARARIALASKGTFTAGEREREAWAGFPGAPLDGWR